MSSTTRDPELERFKVDIDLREYAMSCGYELNRKKTSRHTAVMRNGGAVILIEIGHDGHWIYYSTDLSDQGSIIDFVMREQGCNLGYVRKILRPWVGSAGYAPRRASQNLYLPDLEPSSKDLSEVRAQYACMPAVIDHPYLVQDRLLPPATLASPRFAGRIRIDHRGNAIFPHFNREGVCGFEIKNTTFTGFASGGLKGLWISQAQDDDTHLVVSETAIDALSYAACHDLPKARYVSTAGSLSPDQMDLLQGAIKKMPAGAQIILAFDNDDGGRALIGKIKALLAATDAPGATLEEDTPLRAGEDWNDVLRASMGKSNDAPELG